MTTGWSTRTADAVIRREPVVGTRWAYEWATLLKGVDQVRRATGDRRHLEYIRSNVDRFLQGGGIATYAREAYDLDSVAGGPLLLSLFRETGDERYSAAALILREQLRAQPRTPSGGFWHKRVYPDQMWLDGIYMAGPFYAEFAVLFGEPEGLDDVARQITLIAERTRDERTGLLRHAWDESRRERWAEPTTGRSPCAWGRAIGWFAMALADILELLPERSTRRERIASVLADTMAAVKRVQDDASGVWWRCSTRAGARATTSRPRPRPCSSTRPRRGSVSATSVARTSTRRAGATRASSRGSSPRARMATSRCTAPARGPAWAADRTNRTRPIATGRMTIMCAVRSRRTITAGSARSSWRASSSSAHPERGDRDASPSADAGSPAHGPGGTQRRAVRRARGTRGSRAGARRPSSCRRHGRDRDAGVGRGQDRRASLRRSARLHEPLHLLVARPVEARRPSISAARRTDQSRGRGYGPV